ncbi:cardiolipin synthase [Janibacter sp. GS2]|uniref:cardiolipin synthase n=1 Tax=Janibacter sp. GS2 TaxID=3442646 RepID=UPI003EB7D16D
MSGLHLSLLGGGLVVVLDLVLRVLALIYVPPNRRPTAAMAWLLAIFFIPVLGGALFLLIGSPRLPRSRLTKQAEMDEAIADHAAESPAPAGSAGPEWWPGVVRMNQELTAMPLLGGNRGALIGDYAESLDAMAEEIAGARAYVHVEFYILSLDQSTGAFFDALEAAVARGVTVRVLLDHWSSSHCRDYQATIARLEAMGAHWHLMLPVQPLKGRYQRLDLRNHRKLLVVDGRVAFMGSQNLIDRSYNKKKNLARGLKWQDLMTRVEGPVVESIDLVFATDWYMESGERLDRAGPPPPRSGVTAEDDLLECQVVPSGPGYPVENNLQLFLSLLYAARERVAITSPYFVPDESMLRGIMAAITRGVTVELFVSEIGDQALVWHAQRSYYAPLLDAGMRIYQYPAPYILHAKHFSIDDEVAVIGSSNMDMRSFGLNCEVSLMVRSPLYVAQMRAVEAEYRRISTELTAQEWAQEPLRRTAVDGLARLTSALQ